tara:strand:- start:137 stop:1756 length:1620 start_codon:yes stop_codon:yes gene_type:complete
MSIQDAYNTGAGAVQGAYEVGSDAYNNLLDRVANVSNTDRKFWEDALNTGLMGIPDLLSRLNQGPDVLKSYYRDITGAIEEQGGLFRGGGIKALINKLIPGDKYDPFKIPGDDATSKEQEGHAFSSESKAAENKALLESIIKEREQKAKEGSVSTSRPGGPSAYESEVARGGGIYPSMGGGIERISGGYQPRDYFGDPANIMWPMALNKAKSEGRDLTDPAVVEEVFNETFPGGNFEDFNAYSGPDRSLRLYGRDTAGLDHPGRMRLRDNEGKVIDNSKWWDYDNPGNVGYLTEEGAKEWAEANPGKVLPADIKTEEGYVIPVKGTAGGGGVTPGGSGNILTGMQPGGMGGLLGSRGFPGGPLSDPIAASERATAFVYNDPANFMRFAPTALQMQDPRFYGSTSFMPAGQVPNFNMGIMGLPGQMYANYYPAGSVGQMNPLNKQVMGMPGGGNVMQAADGGYAEYPRMNGHISGPGTERSDDIPAMLSDGEFVVNARGVRGIGSLMGMKKPKSKAQQRREGAKVMYALQKAGEQAAGLS